MNLVKRIFSIMMCGMIAISAAALVPHNSLEAEAATFSDVNASSVFVKQQKSDTCTLASNVMLLRRTALMRGDSDWSSITESACRPTLWCEGVGMYHNYTYKNITVSYQYISGSVTTTLINALKEHPEGIVVYDYDYPHAILLTDYTDGVFYCADPANNVPSGRIKASQALISLSNVDTYWYVSSPDVSFSGSSNGGSNSGDNSGGSSSVNEKWKITSSNGVNMRSGAGTSYIIVGAVPYNATVTVTKKTSSGGYTWGYTTYGGTSGWIALDYASKVASTALTNNSTISKTTINNGDSITLKASATGGTSPYQYAFTVKHSTASSWTTVKSYNTTATKTWTPAKTGTYEVCAKVKDSNGTEVKKFFTLTVKEASFTNNSTISKTTITQGSPITINVSASGGTSPYKYAVTVRHSTASSWSVVKAYNTTSTVTWNPAKTGIYEVCAKVKDSNGTEVKKFFTLTVNENKNAPQNNSTISKTTINKGDSITLKASATGGTSPYQYAFTVKHSTESNWTTIKAYNTTATKTWTPAKTGIYEVCAKVKDANGTEVKKFFTLTVK
ncbi:MAG: SH3 domain-containing protein [Acutalibacteraceae bacterium]